MHFPALLSTADICIDHVEIKCSDTTRVDGDSFEKVGLGLAAALSEVAANSGGLSIPTVSFTRALHAELGKANADAFLRRFSANAPQDLGPLLGSGAVYYFGPRKEQLTLSIALDRSVIRESAVFLRIICILDSNLIGTTGFRKAADQVFQDVLVSLSLRAAS